MAPGAGCTRMSNSSSILIGTRSVKQPSMSV